MRAPCERRLVNAVDCGTATTSCRNWTIKSRTMVCLMSWCARKSSRNDRLYLTDFADLMRILLASASCHGRSAPRRWNPIGETSCVIGDVRPGEAQLDLLLPAARRLVLGALVLFDPCRLICRSSSSIRPRFPAVNRQSRSDRFLHRLRYRKPNRFPFLRFIRSFVMLDIWTLYLLLTVSFFI